VRNIIKSSIWVEAESYIPSINLIDGIEDINHNILKNKNGL
jgi:hypothetical protein